MNEKDVNVEMENKKPGNRSISDLLAFTVCETMLEVICPNLSGCVSVDIHLTDRRARAW